MPVISRFYGMVVKMYFADSEHNPPHFHVVYGEYAGVFDLDTLRMTEGDLPEKAQSLVPNGRSSTKTRSRRFGTPSSSRASRLSSRKTYASHDYDRPAAAAVPAVRPL